MSLLRPHVDVTGRRLGEIAVEQAWVSADQLSEALRCRNAAERLGEVLVRLGYLSALELDFLLAQQRGAPAAGGAGVERRLGELLRLAGRLQGPEMARALRVQRRTNERLGTVLVKLGLLGEAELEAVLAWQADLAAGRPNAVRLLLGEILVASRRLDRAALEAALEDQRRTGGRLGGLLVKRGLVSREDLRAALKAQGRLAAMALLAVVGTATLTACGAPRVPSQPAYGKEASFDRYRSPRLTDRLPSFDASRHQFKVAALPGGRELQQYDDGSRIVRGVPFFRQGSDNTCGQAVMAVLLNFWDRRVTYQAVVDDANRFNLPTTHEGLTSYLQGRGLEARAYRRGSLALLKERVDHGRPPIVLLEFNDDLFQQHYVVVLGYNEAKGTVIFHDSIDGPYRQLDEDTFYAMWQARNLARLPLFGGADYQGLVVDVGLPPQG